MAREREAAAISRLSTYLVSEVSTATVVDTFLTRDRPPAGGRRGAAVPARRSRGLRPAGAAPDGAPPPSDDVVAAATGPGSTTRRSAYRRRSDERRRRTAARRAPRPPVTGAADGSGMYVPLRGATGVQGVLRVTAHRGRPQASGRRSPVWRARWPTSSPRSSSDSGCRRRRRAPRPSARPTGSSPSLLVVGLARAQDAAGGAHGDGEQPARERRRSGTRRTCATELRGHRRATSTRLNNSIGALLDLSRLEARAWEPRRETGTIWTTSSRPASTRCRRTSAAAPEACDIPDDLPPVFVDYEQWSRCCRT